MLRHASHAASASHASRDPVSPKDQALNATMEESQRVLQTLISNLPGMVYRCQNDPQWTMSFVSDGCYPLTGYDRSELEQSRMVAYADLIHREDRDALWNKCQASLDAKRPCNNEYRIVTKSGDVKWVWERAAGIYAADGALLAIEGFITDVTERRRAEAERHDAVQALAASEQRYRGLVHTMHELVAEITPAGVFQLVNQAFCKATGYDEADLVGSDLGSYLHEEDRAAALEDARRLIQDGRVIRNCEYRFRTKDGQYRYLVANGDPIRDAAGDLRSMAIVCFDLTERKAAEETILRLAYYDPLTALPNRTLLQDRLAQVLHAAQRSSQPVSFLVMDLDHFKDINNTLGHHYGDRLIEQLGARLQRLLREADTVARWGGDEFAILLPDTDLEGALRVADKLRTALAAPFMLDALALVVEASIGIAVYPQHGAAPETVIQHANVAMYAAKHARSGQAVYASEQDHHSPKRLALMGELRYAIDHDELLLYYQPKIDLRARRTTGVEALVRWKHPDRGIIPPDEFIPLAERTVLIKPLSTWVFAAAKRQVERWRRAGRRISVAVNLSVRSLHDVSLPQAMTDLVAPTDPWLEIEITESTLMADPARAMSVLHQLHHMGIPLAIDDFGTGYSSLAYLKRLPVSTIKIDKSFVKNMAEDGSDSAIVRSTIDLAHHLGLGVVAEGVETETILDRLTVLGCDFAQGYYFARPLPSDAINRWFDTSPWSNGLPPSNLNAA